MREKIYVENAIKNEKNEVILIVNNDFSIKELSATGQVLVDSNELAFVYIVEKDESFMYVELTLDTWPILKEGLENNCKYNLSNGNETIVLPNLREELLYLIDNIKGNSNYGEEMVTKVEECFCN
ncbi:hypothetical protein M3175_16990 [Robertmurraya korlensis]|uniref:UPF0738 family protein n=1 Tax=Robertmurraya korlensis TaxID=519977 RepID=UPI002040F480|nr:hypothetical protein [Robertmurraya korlensis]MCM3602432.1 hypothetical protein [Robertmurraya korlensis]